MRTNLKKKKKQAKSISAFYWQKNVIYKMSTTGKQREANALNF